MFEKSDFLYLSDMKLVFKQGHSFIIQPGTTIGFNGVATSQDFLITSICPCFVTN